MTTPGPERFAGYSDSPISQDAAAAASRSWWNENAHDYVAERGEFLGARDLCWCPEGLRESEASLLGDVARKRILEVGAGAAQGASWLLDQGADVVATDISETMLRHASASPSAVPRIAADARHLPFADGSFDTVFTAYGVIPFLSDVAQVHREVYRVLKHGGRWVFSTTHPVRWAFPDVGTEAGLTVTRSYFDTRPYIETDETGKPVYAEFHRTLGEHIREIIDAGFVLADVIEPTWPDEHVSSWDGWSPLRGKLIPGTIILVSQRD